MYVPYPIEIKGAGRTTESQPGGTRCATPKSARQMPARGERDLLPGLICRPITPWKAGLRWFTLSILSNAQPHRFHGSALHSHILFLLKRPAGQNVQAPWPPPDGSWKVWNTGRKDSSLTEYRLLCWKKVSPS